jgi:hypothetical protein
MKIQDYTITMAYSAEDLEDSVKRLIKQGWQPMGGPFIQDMSDGDDAGLAGVRFHQAMIQSAES